MDKKYKYHLATGGRKLRCPNCGHLTFVPYLDAANNIVDADKYGRCDRENSCKYICYPNGVERHIVEGEAPTPKQLQPLICTNPDIVRIDMTSNLFMYAVKLIGLNKAILAWQIYKVGNYSGSVVFWQISADFAVKTAKIIPYAENGHRRKDTTPAKWAHKVQPFAQYFRGEELQQCFFGEHLLSDSKITEVVIVESEKTAVIMGGLNKRPHRAIIATGGSHNLSKLCERAQQNDIFLHRKIILCPDEGQSKNWQKIALRYNFKVYDICEHSGIAGCDILDLYEMAINNDITLLKNERLKAYYDDLNGNTNE